MERHLSPSIMACRDHANTDFLGRLASRASFLQVKVGYGRIETEDRQVGGWMGADTSP